MAVTWATTLDNPWDYFTHFDEWNAFDQEKGYFTNNYVARICMASSEMSEKDYEDAVEAAVDEICRLNITGNYKKIVKNEEEKKIEDKEIEEKIDE